MLDNELVCYLCCAKEDESNNNFIRGYFSRLETRYSLPRKFCVLFTNFPCHCYFAMRVIDCRYKSLNKTRRSIKSQQMIMNFSWKSRRIEVWLSTRVNGFKISAASLEFLPVGFCNFYYTGYFLSQALKDLKESWTKDAS